MSRSTDHRSLVVRPQAGEKLLERQGGDSPLGGRSLVSAEAAPGHTSRRATLKDMAGAPGKYHPTSGRSPGGQFALGLWGQFRLVFVPDQDPMPRLADGGLDQALVTKISIWEVVDYHGD